MLNKCKECGEVKYPEKGTITQLAKWKDENAKAYNRLVNFATILGFIGGFITAQVLIFLTP